MKNVLVLGVAALALVGCAKKEEAPAAPAAEATAPVDPCAVTVTPAPAGQPAAEPTVTTPSAECVASKQAEAVAATKPN